MNSLEIAFDPILMRIPSIKVFLRELMRFARKKGVKHSYYTTYIKHRKIPESCR